MKPAQTVIPFLLLLAALVFTSCGEAPSEAAPEDNSTIKGKKLAAQYCQSCHLLPDPNLLDRENWKAALAMMGPRLGIYEHNGQRYTIFTDVDQAVYPGVPAMNPTEWQQIIDYYTQAAPSVLPVAEKTKVIPPLPFFSIVYPGPSFSREGNTASYVKIESNRTGPRLWVSRSGSNTLYLFNNRLTLLDSVITNGPVVDIDFQKDELLTCTIGANLYGNNSKAGQVSRLSFSKGSLLTESTPMFDTLARPLQVISADLNGDHQPDYLICAFGNMFGSLLWMENKGNGQYLRHELRSMPGATHACINDYNHDGRPDIWAQFAQGEEGIFLFTNKGDGSFEEKELLRFPPSYGSTSFELDDFNHDGFPDILYTCGDRGDGINQLKPYHGVYVFLNDGKNAFKQQFVYHINGCMKAMANDFDKDGDLDIAAIGFFTDNNQPEEGFTFLLNKGSLDFEPYALPQETGFTKATTMDVADIDADGKADILLGHGFIGNKAMDKKRPLFIVLKNRF